MPFSKIRYFNQAETISQIPLIGKEFLQATYALVKEIFVEYYLFIIQTNRKWVDIRLN